MNKYHHRTVYHMDKAAAQKCYDQGMADADIAESCSVAVSTVARWRRMRGLPAHRVVKKKPKKSPLAQRAEEAKAAGKTYGQYMAGLRGGKW